MAGWSELLTECRRLRRIGATHAREVLASRARSGVLMGRFLALFFMVATVACGQGADGELRLKITDPSGLGVRTTVELASEASQF